MSFRHVGDETTDSRRCSCICNFRRSCSALRSVTDSWAWLLEWRKGRCREPGTGRFRRGLSRRLLAAPAHRSGTGRHADRRRGGSRRHGQDDPAQRRRRRLRQGWCARRTRRERARRRPAAGRRRPPHGQRRPRRAADTRQGRGRTHRGHLPSVAAPWWPVGTRGHSLPAAIRLSCWGCSTARGWQLWSRGVAIANRLTPLSCLCSSSPADGRCLPGPQGRGGPHGPRPRRLLEHPAGE